MKNWLRRFRWIRAIDDWSDTSLGESVCYAIIILAIILLFAYMVASGLPRRVL